MSWRLGEEGEQTECLPFIGWRDPGVLARRRRSRRGAPLYGLEAPAPAHEFASAPALAPARAPAAVIADAAAPRS